MPSAISSPSEPVEIDFGLHRDLALAETHDRALAEGPLDLAESGVQCFGLSMPSLSITFSAGCDIASLPYSIWGGFSAMARMYVFRSSLASQNRIKNRTKEDL